MSGLSMANCLNASKKYLGELYSRNIPEYVSIILSVVFGVCLINEKSSGSKPWGIITTSSKDKNSDAVSNAFFDQEILLSGMKKVWLNIFSTFLNFSPGILTVPNFDRIVFGSNELVLMTSISSLFNSS